ncbi:hypothetical protein BDD43_1271 [Mucilaginibacter gracilis]|uniref:ABC-2 type transport system permease protein n=1 Tax=Mucilaginibacter gracilis TaxID=423350 RepID=A0A495IWJ8_9SPHI|nr:DUF5687 family protein [Mucilaginibacter gracilis]RKR81127.1 hypothetical protein BDD43_1271 [Mucilaginibacter gracilis]
MTLTFIRHELKAFWRSKNSGKALAVRIVMGILIALLLLEVLALAFFMDTLLVRSFPKQNLITSFSGILFYYFLFDLLMRFQLQELPTLQVQPYLHLAIKKNALVRYLSFASLQSFFNLWPFILFTPFICKFIWYNQGFITALVFFLSIIAFAGFNNYLALYIKRRSNINGWISVAFAATLSILVALDFKWGVVSFRVPSLWFFGHLSAQPALLALPVLLAVGMYYVNFLYLKSNLYLEELGSRKTSYKSSTEYPVLDRFGKVGDLVGNEIKLIFRNKRSRSAFIMTSIFLLYGLLFYTNKVYGEGWKVFCGQFMTGIFIINYGQFMYGWQASHFDGILVSKVKFSDFLKAKYLLFTTVSTVAFILTLPYAYFGWHIIVVHFAMYLWNIGISTNVVLFFANRNYKRIDLSKGASFNWEGVGATQLLVGFPLMITPYIVYGPLAWLKHPDIALLILGAIGAFSFMMRPYWIKYLEKDFNNRKYTIAEGFRNK